MAKVVRWKLSTYVQDHIKQPCAPKTASCNFVSLLQHCRASCHKRSKRLLWYAITGHNSTLAGSATPAGPDAGNGFDFGTARNLLERQLLTPESPQNLWMAAIKAPMYTVAYIPIIVRVPKLRYVLTPTGRLPPSRTQNHHVHSSPH
jgi:hypothetical protein